MEKHQLTDDDIRLVSKIFEQEISKAEDIPFTARLRLLNTAPQEVCYYISEHEKVIKDLAAYVAVAARNNIAHLRKELAKQKAKYSSKAREQNEGGKTLSEKKTKTERSKELSQIQSGTEKRIKQERIDKYSVKKANSR